MITVNINLLNQVQNAVNPKAFNEAIRGVRIEDDNGYRVYTGTDRHILFNARERVQDDELKTPITLKLLKAVKSKVKYGELVLLDDKETAVIKTSDEKVACDLIDSSYPDWRRIVPFEASKASAYTFFDPDLLKKAIGFTQAVKEEVPQQADSLSAAMWTATEDDGAVEKICIVMPMRQKR